MHTKTTPSPASGRLYPLPHRSTDTRFTPLLLLDVAHAIARHGYPPFTEAHDVAHLRPRPEQLSAFYRQKSATMAASSVRRLHAVLRRALNVAMRWNLIAVNPATLIDARR